MDQTKEYFPKVMNNLAINRGMHVISMDGQGRATQICRKFVLLEIIMACWCRCYLIPSEREEIDSELGIYGVSMGAIGPSFSKL